MRFHFKFLCLWITFSLFISFAPTTFANSIQEPISNNEPVDPTAPSAIDSLEQLQQMQPEEVVPATYAKLERLIAASGTDIEITTDSFVLWTEDQFSLLQWSSLTDTPQVPGLSIGSRHKTHLDGQRSLSFSASWIPRYNDWQPRQAPYGDRNVADVLKASAQSAPWAAEIDALATFQVSLRLDDKAVHYQAAMLFREDGQQRLHLHPVDPIIQNLDIAIQQRPELLTDQVDVSHKGFLANLDATLGSGWIEPSGTQKASTEDKRRSFPVLIQLSTDQISLTGLDDPVSFDMDADGYAETIGWIARDGNAAFLALDRNGNGAIDDGRELFGTMTHQPETPEPSGFMALAVFDQASVGGNNDGVISDGDNIFSSLVLWHDRDHNGISHPSELISLRNSGITSIGLNLLSIPRRDTHGNQLRYGAAVQFDRLATHHFGAMGVQLVSSQN